jgi:thiamine biosynthesis lipoprotein
MSTDTRHSLNGPTMGTRWTAVIVADAGFDTAALAADLAAAVARVDDQMSTWKPSSDLMRLNRAAVGEWQALPPQTMAVLAAAQEMAIASEGLFDIAVGDLVAAWGFGPALGRIDPARIKVGVGKARLGPSFALDMSKGQARRLQDVQLDLSGIAKGYAVDQLAETCARHGIANYLVGIDGEMRAAGHRPDAAPWAVALEAPVVGSRTALGVIELSDRAVATSGDYRHFVTLGQTRLSHTMNPRTGGPVQGALASVSVLAATCMQADAWATVLLILGEAAGPAMARAQGIEAIFLVQRESGIEQIVISPN